MKKFRLLALLLFGFAANIALAQNVKVTGVVTSSEDGLPLPGVTVIIEGTSNGTGTSADGSYVLNNVPSNGALEFRQMGMKTQVVQVNGRTKIDVVMAPDALVADEAVVTALGIRKQNRALGYATTTVDGEDLARTNQVNPINALQGKVAGVQINSAASGGVTSSPSITIRGAKSLTKSNQPIFVIDGIVLEGTTGGTFENGTNMWGDQLKNINPNDIESQTILKGAAATSLYGSRGANGAIVITTKRGKSRKGLGIEVSYTHEFQNAYKGPIELQNEFGMGYPTNGYQGEFIESEQSYWTSYIAQSFGGPLDGSLVQQFYKGPDSVAEPFVAYPDNWKAFYQTGQYDNANVALTGGTDNVTYRLGYSFTRSTGTSPGNSFSRHNIDFSTTGKVNDLISVFANVKYANSNAANPARANIWANDWSTLMQTAYYVNRNTDLQWVADNYIQPDENWARLPLNVTQSTKNYFNSANDNNISQKELSIIAQLGVNFTFTDYLDASVQASFSDYQTNREEKNYGSGLNRAGGYYGISGSTSGKYDGQAQIHYGESFVDDRLNVDVRVVSEIYGNTQSSSYWKQTSGGLITPGLFNFANSASTIKTSDMSIGYTPRNNMTIGLAGIASVDWDNQVYLEVTARNDWVSSLLYPTWIPQGANNYSVFYPSVNASWVFSDTFQIDPAVLSFGKLRASWAQVGMGTNAYSTANGAGGFSQGAAVTPDGGSVIYSTPNNGVLPNYDLKPEIQQSIEFGADLRFLDDKIGVDVAYYKTNTFNQILSVSAAPESGVGSQLINAGNIQNQGWEVQMDFTPIQNRDWRWNISANYTRNRSLVKELHEDVNNYQLMGSVGYSPSIYAMEGTAFGQVIAGNGWGGISIAYQNDPSKAHYGSPIINYLGAYGSPNSEVAMRYQTANNIAGYYDNTDKYPGDENGYIYDVLGNVEPDFLFGINTNLTYKNWDLYVQVDGRVGGMVINPGFRYAMGMGTTEASLAGRSAEHGGVARLNYKGETVYNGIILDGVFGDEEVVSLKDGSTVNLEGMSHQEAIDAGHVQAVNANIFYPYNYNWSCPAEYQAQEMSYIALREVSVGYNFPERWVSKIGMQSARLQFSARNLAYLYNNLSGGTNPESLTSNNPLTPFDYSGVPFVRNFAITLNVRF